MRHILRVHSGTLTIGQGRGDLLGKNRREVDAEALRGFSARTQGGHAGGLNIRGHLLVCCLLAYAPSSRLNNRAPMDKALFLGLDSVIHGRIRQSCHHIRAFMRCGHNRSDRRHRANEIGGRRRDCCCHRCLHGGGGRITVGIGPTKPDQHAASQLTAEALQVDPPLAADHKIGSDSTTKAGAGVPGVGACVAGNRVVTAGIGPMNSGSARSTITGAGIVGEAVIDDAAIGIGPMNSAEGAGFTMGIVSMNSAEGAGSTMGIGTRGMTLSDASGISQPFFTGLASSDFRISMAPFNISVAVLAGAPGVMPGAMPGAMPGVMPSRGRCQHRFRMPLWQAGGPAWQCHAPPAAVSTAPQHLLRHRHLT